MFFELKTQKERYQKTINIVPPVQRAKLTLRPDTGHKAQAYTHAEL